MYALVPKMFSILILLPVFTSAYTCYPLDLCEDSGRIKRDLPTEFLLEETYYVQDCDPDCSHNYKSRNGHHPNTLEDTIFKWDHELEEKHPSINDGKFKALKNWFWSVDNIPKMDKLKKLPEVTLESRFDAPSEDEIGEKIQIFERYGFEPEETENTKVDGEIVAQRHGYIDETVGGTIEVTTVKAGILTNNDKSDIGSDGTEDDGTGDHHFRPDRNGDDGEKQDENEEDDENDGNEEDTDDIILEVDDENERNSKDDEQSSDEGRNSSEEKSQIQKRNRYANEDDVETVGDNIGDKETDEADEEDSNSEDADDPVTEIAGFEIDAIERKTTKGHDKNKPSQNDETENSELDEDLSDKNESCKDHKTNEKKNISDKDKNKTGGDENADVGYYDEDSKTNPASDPQINNKSEEEIINRHEQLISGYSELSKNQEEKTKPKESNDKSRKPPKRNKVTTPKPDTQGDFGYVEVVTVKATARK